MGRREYYATYGTQLQVKKGPNVFSTLLKVLKAFDPKKSLKIPQDLLVLWKFFVPLFSAGWILVCFTHLLPLRFGTQVT
jgi:formate hydrogenlyase subunit 4